MGVQTQTQSEQDDHHDDDSYCTYEEILSEEELVRLQNEFQPRLKKTSFLDHTGATLYANSQIDGFRSELESTLFSNPHSRNPSSSITTDAIDCIRQRILEHFGTTGEDYSVIFTSGATAALKLLAESFRFNGGTFAYLEESHTSVVGMREIVGRGGKHGRMKREPNPGFGSESKQEDVRVYCLAKSSLEKLMECECANNSGCCTCNQNDSGVADTHLMSQDHGSEQKEVEEAEEQGETHGLLAYPAQCNFSGLKYPLDWLVKVREHGLHLDEINQIEHFYIQPEHLSKLRRDHERAMLEEWPSKQSLNLVSELLSDQKKSPQEQQQHEKGEYEEQGQSCLFHCGGKLPAESFHIKNKQSGNGSSTTNREEEETDDKADIPNGSTQNSSLKQQLAPASTPKFKTERKGRRRLNWYVVLDAASYVATSRLDLSLYPADFIAVSFYKMFGFPTGLGALIVRNESSHLLEKGYFGGGTVNIQLPWEGFHAKRDRFHERFEDGTISFLSILALRHGFDALQKLGRSIDTITTRTFRLARYFYHNLVRMKYSNGQPLAVVYSDTTYESEKTQGPIVTFNLLRRDGTVIGYSEMEQMAYLHDVHLRYGCFCNVGACRRHLGHRPEDVMKHYEAGHVCGDMKDVIDGKPTGAIRMSVGYMTSRRELDSLLRLIRTCWLGPFQDITEDYWKEMGREREEGKKEKGDTHRFNGEETDGASHYGSPRKVSRIFVYPVKSCAPFQVSKMWGIGSRGLLYDREWLIVNSSGVPLTQKREPRLCQLKPNIDVSNRRLVLSMEGFPDVSIPLETKQVEQQGGRDRAMKADLCTSKVCGDVISALDCGEQVAEWLSNVFSYPGLRLIRMNPDQLRKPRKALDQISLANISQYLLISMGSLRLLARQLLQKDSSWGTNSWVSTEDGEGFEDAGSQPVSKETEFKLAQVVEDLIWRFRPNLVITDEDVGAPQLSPYEEETWEEVRIGSIPFKSGGPCTRCATICTDQKTGQRTSEPFLTLSASREGKANFGIHLYRAKDALKTEDENSTEISSLEHVSVIHVGDPIVVQTNHHQQQSAVNGINKKNNASALAEENGKVTATSGNQRKLIDNID